jgi:hypothetical protein
MNELEPYDTASSVAVTSPLSEKDTCEPILSTLVPPDLHISYYSNRIGVRLKDKAPVKRPFVPAGNPM